MARTNVNVADQVYHQRTFSKELDGRPQDFTVSEAAMSMGNSVNSKVMVSRYNSRIYLRTQCRRRSAWRTPAAPSESRRILQSRLVKPTAWPFLLAVLDVNTLRYIARRGGTRNAPRLRALCDRAHTPLPRRIRSIHERRA